MLLNASESFSDRAKALQDLGRKFRKEPASLINHLFFAARNGAIARVLRELETYFRNEGLPVVAHWDEDCRSAAIRLELVDKRGNHVRRIYLNRSVEVPGQSLAGSGCMYAVDKIVAGEYYRSRKPKVAEQFDAILESKDFHALVATLVTGTNYPFAYESFSSV